MIAVGSFVVGTIEDEATAMEARQGGDIGGCVGGSVYTARPLCVGGGLKLLRAD
jgi:hypothetical protein